MRHILFTILFGLMLHSTSGWSDSVVIGEEDDGAYVIKHIVGRVGERIRALVSDREGQIREIVISEADAHEVKRNLWVVRPGVYTSDL